MIYWTWNVLSNTIESWEQVTSMRQLYNVCEETAELSNGQTGRSMESEKL